MCECIHETNNQHICHICRALYSQIILECYLLKNPIFGRIAEAISVYRLAMSVCLSVCLSVNNLVKFLVEANIGDGKRYIVDTWSIHNQ